MEISRPGEAAGKLAHRLESAVPLGAQLTVAASEKVAFVLAGSVVGVVEAGQHRLDPQSLPFLDMCVQGDRIEAELWFIANGLHGLRYGGALQTLFNPQTGKPFTPRCFGSYSIHVTDLRRLLVMGLLGEPDLGEGWIRARIIGSLSRALSQFDTSTIDVKDPGTLAAVAERARVELAAKLTDRGLALELSLDGLVLAP
jgi:membrane protease subunit (stomatin/prohibitin family)